MLLQARKVGDEMSLLGGFFAAALAAIGMAILRSTLQVRSIPERVMEWMLLFIPPALFETAIQRFGFDAKRYALYGAIIGMLAVLAFLGSVALRERWSSWALLALGLGLWLFTMVVIMPLTGAGFFAVMLIDGTRAASLGYLAVGLTYAATLSAFRAVLPDEDYIPWMVETTREARKASRRSAIILASGAVASFVVTFVADRLGPRTRLTTVVVSDPQEPVPSGGIDQPQPHPQMSGPVQPRPASEPLAAAGAGSEAQPSPAAAARVSTSSSLPEPPPPRQMARDKDGAAMPSGRSPGQLSDLITKNEDFYVVTKNAAGDPMLRPDSWRLRLDGEVQQPVELDYASLRNLPAVEVTKTLECISNFVAKCDLAPFGCDLISTARWKGVRLSDVLGLAGGLKPGVVSLATIGADEFTAALPIDAALEPDTLLVYEMNGQVLPRDHGYPARVLVPGRYGMKNPKWVVALRAMNREFVDWYGQRNWSRQAIVKTMTRIDVPAPGAELSPGEQRISGVAYAGDRGVAKVEFSPDGGATWQTAELIEPPAGADTWVRWQGRFGLAPGSGVTLMARATDGSGALQAEAFSLPQPDGSSGWNTIEVQAKRA
jgi:DMSO/TMAO reductase YedYZ molybdopterin-dependent catalytic subunit